MSLAGYPLYLYLPLTNSKTVLFQISLRKVITMVKKGEKKNACSAFMFQNEHLNPRQKQKPNGKGYQSSKESPKRPSTEKLFPKKEAKRIRDWLEPVLLPFILY